MNKIRNHPAYRPALLAILAAVLAWGMLTGCSGLHSARAVEAVAEIPTHTREAGQGVAEIRAANAAIREQVDRSDAAAAAVDARLAAIDERAKRAIVEAAKAEAKAEWGRNARAALRLVAWIVAGVAVLVVVAACWPAIRRLAGWVPTPARSTAKLLDEAIAEPERIRDAVAYIRARNPDVDAAFRKRRETAR